MSETIVGEKGMVVAPHFAAAEAGANVLRMGGNALEAMIAAAAAIAVAYPHMNGIGGDAFFLASEPGRAPFVIEGCGGAGSLATIARYREQGHDTIPERGPGAAVTVAGAISAWIMARQAAASWGGRLPLPDLLGPAIGLAKDGIAVTASQRSCAADNKASLHSVPTFAKTYLNADGSLPEIGDMFVQSRIGDVLEQLVHAGLEDFYRGDVGAEIGADLEALDTPVTRGDLERQTARKVDPLTVALSDAALFNTPPPTQGLASLIILAIFDRLGIQRGETFEHVHALIEASKQAFAMRDSVITDPAFGNDVTPALAADRIARMAKAIDMTHAAPSDGQADTGDTVWLGAIDGEGRTVSFIQSLYWEYGSGVVLPRTGITWQNRGISFSLDSHAVNPLRPGRKPFHTLNPAFARFRDGRSMVYGSMGGDGQPQFQSQIFSRHARFGEEPGEAIAAPRWRWGRTWGDDHPGVAVENRMDPDVIRALERAGHTIDVLDTPYSDGMGHAGMIVRDARGRLIGASDPRSDGQAVAA